MARSACPEREQLGVGAGPAALPGGFGVPATVPSGVAAGAVAVSPVIHR
ncbi:hypothetical protein J2S55_001247 [Streptosporangium brasiliense]|uniref:Uncharacterized protein n=1 Tax=Streptosporangium brasiliense TaxID=47480 RepID=A0ABT9QYB4_9ACTN|nr:hypothetical protein [Streptosporangium brasiliense]